MATISPSTFDPLRRYVGVRLQSGVPIVDADENEREDVRRFELRAYLAWFVGDGVPFGNGGFRIEGTGLANDFQIRSGVTGAVDGLANVGRCLVKGLDVIIPADVAFTAQPLHEGNGAAADQEAARVVAPKVAALATPAADGLVTVYLDVWERLVTPMEDATLILPGLGTESCARMKREWVVRVRAGTTAPQPGDPDFLGDGPGELRHDYYALAHIRRRAGDATVTVADVVDRREQRLLMPPATLVADVLGTDAVDYRRGLNRPPISLREAINALLRGELPSTPDAAIAPDPAQDTLRRALVLDGTGGLLMFWRSNRFGATDHAVGARLALDDAAGGFTGVQQLTSAAPHVEPEAAVLPNGDILLVCTRGPGASADVVLKRAPFAGLAAAAEVPVAATAGVAETSPSVVVSGQVATIFFRVATANAWQYRRRRLTDNTFLDGAGVNLSAVPATVSDFHAALHPTGHVWAAYRTQGNDIRALRLNPSAMPTATVDNELTWDSGGDVLDERPFVLPTAGGDVVVFWQTPNGLSTRRFRAGWQPIEAIANTLPGDRMPCAVEAADGGVWLFWSRGAPSDLFAMRRHPDSGMWGQPRQLTLSAGEDVFPYAVVGPDQAVWIVWLSDRDGNPNLYFKRLITAL